MTRDEFKKLVKLTRKIDERGDLVINGAIVFSASVTISADLIYNSKVVKILENEIYAKLAKVYDKAHETQPH